MTVSIPPARAEQSEAAALYDVETRTPARTQAGLGIEAARIGGGAALLMRNDPQMGFTALCPRQNWFWRSAGEGAQVAA
jgi:hypothetical protein